MDIKSVCGVFLTQILYTMDMHICIHVYTCVYTCMSVYMYMYLYATKYEEACRPCIVLNRKQNYFRAHNTLERHDKHVCINGNYSEQGTKEDKGVVS